MLHVSASTVRNMIHRGRLIADDVHGDWKVRVSSIEAHVAAKRQPEQAKERHAPSEAPSQSRLPAWAVTRDTLDDLVHELFGERLLLMTTKQTAELLRRRHRAVQDAVNLGQIPSRTIGRTRYVPVAELALWLQGQDAA